MQILALDLGTKTGVAWTFWDVYQWCQWDLKPSRHESPGMRFINFRKSLADAVIGLEPDMVLYEEVRRHRGVDAAHAYGGFLAVMQEVLDRRAVPYKGVPVGTIKKHATGKGNANKTAMIEAALELLVAREQRTADATRPITDNEADAIHLLDWGLQEYGPGRQ